MNKNESRYTFGGVKTSQKQRYFNESRCFCETKFAKRCLAAYSVIS
jgi:hypothetical protein